ncbi:hypothetical protein ACFIJ5_06930 [Haloimpatiens sp. FM7330]|uniref:hypothetical protein n=1 Tax=Haloimpatiens sp. FM7330 TaxID=3298610 RepID=UPI00363034F5
MFSRSVNKSTYYYKVIGILGIMLSVLWVSFINTQPFSDFKYYHELAVQISQGGAWGDTYTSVGYPIVLGYIYKIFGTNIMIGKIFNLILYSLNILLLKKILDNVNIDEKKSKIVFTIFVLFPANIFYVSILGTETFFTFLILLVTFLYFSKLKYKYIVVGIVTGLATMVKPFFIAFFFAVFLMEIIFNKNLIHALKKSLIVLVIACLVIAPWIYRNTKLNGQFTTVSNNGGIVLYINNNSQNQLGRWMPAADVENSLVKTEEYKKASMTEKNKMLTKAAKSWIKEHPKQFFTLGVKRLINTYVLGDDLGYSLNGVGIDSNTGYSMIKYYGCVKAVIFLLSILSILMYTIYTLVNLIQGRIYELEKFKVYMLLIFYMFTVVYFITEGQARYAFPLIFIAVFMFYDFIEKIINTFLYKRSASIFISGK